MSWGHTPALAQWPGHSDLPKMATQYTPFTAVFSHDTGTLSLTRPPPMNMRRRERDSGAGERSVCTLPTLHSELAVDHVRPLIVAAVEPLDSCGREGGGGCLHAPVAQPEQ